MIIRYESDRDLDAIEKVIAAAFAPMPFGLQNEHRIVAALRRARALAISLVALEAGRVIGHAAFSPVAIAGKELGWFGLGPVSVLPEVQRGGIGSALIRRGLEVQQERGAAGCVVLGNPDYYRRFGFEADPRLGYDGAPPGKFMRRVISGPVPTGQVTYHAAFALP